MSWWDDGGSFLFGPPWTVVLLINSRPVHWGCGNSILKAKEYVAEKTLRRLKRNHPVFIDNHPVQNKSKQTISEQDSSAGAGDNLTYRVLSRWYRRDGKHNLDGSTN